MGMARAVGLFASLLGTRAGASSVLPGRGADGCVGSFDTTTDYFPTPARLIWGMTQDGRPSSHARGSNDVEPAPQATAVIQMASLFNVTYYKTYKVVQQGSDAPLVLWQCGTPQPATGDAGVPEDARFFRVPLRRAGFTHTIVPPYFEALGLLGSVGTHDITYVSSPCVQKLQQCGIGSAVPTWEAAAWNASAMADDALFIDYTGWMGTGTAKDVPFDASSDMGNLHSAEWIKFLALFFNKEHAANEVFRRIATDYAGMRAQATELAARRAAAPVVAFVTHNKAASWNPVATWEVLGTYYRREFVTAAGGKYVEFPASPPANCTPFAGSSTPEGGSYRCTDAAQFRELLKGVDVLVDETYASDPARHNFTADFLGAFAIAAADAAQYPFLRDGALLRHDRTHNAGGGLDYFEKRVPLPNLFLSDLVSVMYNVTSPSCPLRFLRRLSIDAVEPTTQLGSEHCDAACADIGGAAHPVAMCAATAAPSAAPTPTTVAPSVVAIEQVEQASPAARGAAAVGTAVAAGVATAFVL